MSPNYNLINEEWIPCRLRDGSTVHLGIRKTLEKSHEIMEIYDNTPVVTGGIHRLLLAILHRNLGPRSFRNWMGMLQNGKWDMDLIGEYLDCWKHRFDLFDSERPFYQSGGFEANSLAPINKLSIDRAAGNNAAIFDHSRDDQPTPVTPARAAGLLVGLQTFAIVGGKGYRNGPIGKAAMVVVKGKNLFETLVFNLLEYDPTSGKPLPCQTDDSPVWERPEPTDWGSKRLPIGYLDYLTWQSRRIRLLPDEGTRMVEWMHIASGEGIEGEDVRDPMVAHKMSKKKSLIPVRVDKKRELWRDSTALYRTTGSDSQPPRAVQRLSKAVNFGQLPRSARYNMDVMGLCNDKAKIELWRHSRMPLPAVYLDNDLLVTRLERALGGLEIIGKDLQGGVNSLAFNLLKSGSEGKPDMGEMRNVADSFQIMPQYWSGLEVPFFDLVSCLADEAEDGVEPDAMTKIVDDWVAGDVASKARKLFDGACNGAGTDARSLRAATLARKKFGISLYKSLTKYKEE